jgi:hypothetical protein
MQVFVGRARRKDDATNRLRLTAKEVRAHCRQRQEVEEVSRVLQGQLRLAACQVGDRRRGADPGQPAAAGPRASPRAVFGGVPGAGARALRPRGALEKKINDPAASYGVSHGRQHCLGAKQASGNRTLQGIQAVSHPQRLKGRSASAGAGEKDCGASVLFSIYDERFF